MKPKWYEWVPIYGAIKYWKRYFSADKRTIEEDIVAKWFELYHLSAPFIVAILIIKILAL
jgi:hypothetical protein